MQPSGLIFLVIIAVWATYLLQHWVRRREHLATARSVDRFSDAMRVLERHVPLPGFDLSVTQPRSYSVSPARPSRPEVVVKRVQPPKPPVSTRPAAAVRPTRTFRALAGVSARRIRGLSLLASLSLVVAVPPLAAFSVLPWWSLAVAGAVLTVDFAWLRHAAVAEGANRRVASRAKASADHTRAAASRTATAVGSSAQPLTQRAAHPPVQARPALEASVAGAAEVIEPAQSAAGAALNGWAPVPVPPPTYTLKAKADRPEPAPAAVIEPAPAEPSSFDGLVDDDELDGLLDRRASGA
ncbi:MAG: hypothetical protein ABIP19_14580 [Dermatophilaceae bacterium]